MLFSLAVKSIHLTCVRNRKTIPNDTLSWYLYWTINCWILWKSTVECDFQNVYSVQTMWKFLFLFTFRVELFCNKPLLRISIIFKLNECWLVYMIPKDMYSEFYCLQLSINILQISCRWFHLTFSQTCLQVLSRFLGHSNQIVIYSY